VDTNRASRTASRTGAVKVVDMMLPRTVASPHEKTAAPTRPSRPPNRDRITDSTRNCRRMSRRRAPRALRTPISRMRSVTDTSMMFMTTTPPTMRLMPVTTTVTT
jgi:hypothetical protein